MCLVPAVQEQHATSTIERFIQYKILYKGNCADELVYMAKLCLLFEIAT